MPTFKSNISKVVKQLIDNRDQLGLEPDQIMEGQPGEVPQSAPFIMVFGEFAETRESELYSVGKMMAVEIFAGGSGATIGASIDQSRSLIDKVDKVIRGCHMRVISSTISDDTAYGSVFVTNLRLLTPYEGYDE